MPPSPPTPRSRWSLHIRAARRRLLADLGRLHDPCPQRQRPERADGDYRGGHLQVVFEEMPVRGPWTITVPGAIRHGVTLRTLRPPPWPNLLAPAIDLADGFPASDGWASSIERSASLFGERGDWAQTFRPLGRPWKVGEVVRLPNLAQTPAHAGRRGPGSGLHRPSRAPGFRLPGVGRALRCGPATSPPTPQHGRSQSASTIAASPRSATRPTRAAP